MVILMHMVVAVFGPMGEPFEQQLDEETHHDGCGYLKVEIGGNEAVGVIGEEHVGHQVDEAGGKEKSSTEDVDGIHEPRRHMPAAGDEQGPRDDAYNDERVG
jgi:hypothetical protein